MKRYLDLCSGAGGLSLGLHLAGFDEGICVDINKDACTTLRNNNIPNLTVYNKSISTFDASNMYIDLIAAGLPCQSFSYAGNKLGVEDERGRLYIDYLNIVKETQPKVLLIENVKGLLTIDNGNIFKDIITNLSKLGYNIDYKVLNASYYDVPQNRERLFIIGIRKDIDKVFNWPIPNEDKCIIGDKLDNLLHSIGYIYSNEKYDVMKLVPEGGNWRDLPIDIQKRYMKESYNSSGGKTGIARRLSRSKPSPTLTCSPSQKQTERCHPLYTRPLNVREYAKIQTFPDNYIFYGSISSQYKQIGNAVPVNLARLIGIQILNVLKDNEVIS